MRNADQLIRDFLIKKGIHLGPVNSLFHVRPCQGLVRRTDGTIEKRFAKELTLSPIPVSEMKLCCPCLSYVRCRDGLVISSSSHRAGSVVSSLGVQQAVVVVGTTCISTIRREMRSVSLGAENR